MRNQKPACALRMNKSGRTRGIKVSIMESAGRKRQDRNAKRAIEENLRQVYQELLREDVPERFRILLEELKRAESERQK